MNEAKELEIEGRKGFNLKVYSISSIMNATNSFSDENKLGEGGYGPVYKVKVKNKELYAVYGSYIGLKRVVVGVRHILKPPELYIEFS